MRDYELSGLYPINVKYIESVHLVKLHQNDQELRFLDNQIDEFMEILQQIKSVKKVRESE